ncbi:ATP-dependent DNA helicase Q5 [Habropoda laboriosa]|uniref:ATP-dependent DNA helicase n=2 Tax=Habropoda laboriosa TaxID=597456 RepID=A0A0L7QQQ9_9HYME|nr:ATP-dependent DNA helicase Q5 [Habropoda laboriosa]
MSDEDVSVMNALKSVFGYEKFKNDIQKQAIVSICKGSKDVCISMPPGFGRSLCFQLPIFLSEGKVALIFSPKLSLIKKEIDFLRTKQINACVLHKRIAIGERNNILNDLTSNSPKIILLYATPDMAVITYFQKLISTLKEHKLLAYIVFNEAHCLSQWGYEYTSCYKRINTFVKIYGYVPRIAVTTTVTYKVIEDICTLLTLKTPRVFKIPVQQINVHHDIWFLDILSHPFDHLKNFIVQVLGFLGSSTHKMHKGFGIIYCREEVTVELLKNKLNTLGIPTLACHYKLNDRKRRNIENKWISGEAYVIITTYDYGFIHKKSIRCIIYWTVPENIAKYYRECAQTHADNGRAYCRIYFSMKEYSSVKLVIENHREMNDVEHIQKRLNEYDKIVSYCLSVKCRHVMISKYFGRIIPFCKTNCDVCENEETVHIRTLKFITYSESVEGIKYNISDVNEDLKEEQLELNAKEESEDTSGKECKKSEILSKKIAVDEDGHIQWIKQFNDKLLLRNRQKRPFIESSSLRVQSAENCFQTSIEDTVKCATDNSVEIRKSKLAITQSLVDKCSSDKETISLKLTEKKILKCSTEGIINTEASNNEDVRRNESKLFSDDGKIEVDKREDSITGRESRRAVAIEAKRSDKKPSKRFVTVDTNPEKFKSKRRKLDPENKPTTGTGINRDAGNVSDSYVEHIKDDANGNASRDRVMIEYLMNKYQLNRDSITLEVRRK